MIQPSGQLEMKYISHIIVALLSAAIALWMYRGDQIFGPSKSLSSSTLNFGYSDFISVLLTALAVILGALAIGIGFIAFWTIGEIKREARNIAQEHSRSEMEKLLESIPKIIEETIDQKIGERLPSAIDEAVEKAEKEGRLDDALQKAVMQVSMGGGITNLELQPDFEKQPKAEEGDAE